LHSKIKNELINLGVNPSRIGFEYLTDVINVVLSRAGTKNISLASEVYPKVAKKYHVTAVGINTSIEYALGPIGLTLTATIVTVAGKLGYPPHMVPIRYSAPWTAEQDKIIIDNPKCGVKRLSEMPEFKGKSKTNISRRKRKLLGTDGAIRPRKVHFDNAKEAPKKQYPRAPVPNVTIGQRLKILGRRCKVVYIHPEGLFYQVIFANGIRETVNRSEFNKMPYISWLSKPSYTE
jgi:hypothetical protein